MNLAPEFAESSEDSKFEWLNSDRPLQLKALRGKIVILDFWTSCCINCMHVLPELKRLEKKYAKELIVIGVHSAKFFAERKTQHIRQAILRYDIEHPVVNDREFKIWKKYGVQAWPTIVLINPGGKIEYVHSGEKMYDFFDEKISEMIRRFKTEIDLTAVTFRLEKNKESFLLFPGKIVLDPEERERLFISDSNHHRIVISDGEGGVLDVIGSGREGFSDGSFDEAQFFRPQGLAYREGLLFVADTENHAIRKIDLRNRLVTTVAGTGRQGDLFQSSGPANKISLNSPWDLLLHQYILYIAMAGSHQIWALDLETGSMMLHAGTGYENLVDGPLLKSALAQPSGLTTDGKKLYFADSEVSAIRSADIDRFGFVETIIGGGLFEFGDIDGVGSAVRLQHPMGICVTPAKVGDKQKLFVVDTYNHKIKMVDLIKKTCRTFSGTGKPGYQDGHVDEAKFFEPSGVALLGRQLYVADTGNCQIRKIDLDEKMVSTLEFR